MDFFRILQNKIKNKTSLIGVIGLGYVGLPLVGTFAKKGFKVIGFDNDEIKIKLLRNYRSYIGHIKNNHLKSIKNNFIPTTDLNKIKDVDIIIICLPTPLKKNKNPDLSYIKKTIKNISRYIKKGQLIILESSTYPGSTKELILPTIYKKKYTIGRDYFLGYSPEREDPNNKKFNITNIPKLCSGYSKHCLALTHTLYQTIVKKTIKLSNIETAEFTKIFENTFRSVNIALVNELKLLATKTKLNIYEIIQAAKTKPFGFMAFEPGPGVGGHCIPVDPYYLNWVAKKNNLKMSFIKLAGKINDNMPQWIINKSTLNKKIKKALIIGVAYKKNVDDIRESPALKFINILEKKKITVDYHDPYIPILKSRNLKNEYKSVSLQKINKYDVVYLLTNHDNLNLNYIKKNSKLIVDTRNMFKKNYKNILKL